MHPGTLPRDECGGTAPGILNTATPAAPNQLHRGGSCIREEHAEQLCRVAPGQHPAPLASGTAPHESKPRTNTHHWKPNSRCFLQRRCSTQAYRWPPPGGNSGIPRGPPNEWWRPTVTSGGCPCPEKSGVFRSRHQGKERAGPRSSSRSRLPRLAASTQLPLEERMAPLPSGSPMQI